LQRVFLRQAGLLERLRIRHRWLNVVSSLKEYNYWCGLARAAGGRAGLEALLNECPSPPAVAADAPVVELEALPPEDILTAVLARAGETGLRLCVAGVDALAIPPEPCAEPLRREHLDSALRHIAGRQFIPALAMHVVSRRGAGGWPC
jgi:hypothetical protein